MPTANNIIALQGELVCLMGIAGDGKSTFAMQSPGPHAVLCVDKPVVAPLPSKWIDYNSSAVFYKIYPPPEKDLTDDKQLPSRNVFDAIIRDVQTLKNALISGKPEFEMAKEKWLMPRSIIIEGADFLRKHCMNWVMNVHNKHSMDEWLTSDGRVNRFAGWGLVAAKMQEFYDNLTFFPSIRPVNIIVTIGLDEETKDVKEGGKSVNVKTGNVDPAFGGKMALEGPRKFRDCWLATRAGAKWWLATTPGTKYERFRGLRSGRFGLDPLIDVTLDLKNPVNQWARLFETNKGG